jgi:hypothetical protein
MLPSRLLHAAGAVGVRYRHWLNWSETKGVLFAVNPGLS